jgi:transcriptional regulator with XRE-family HTH domain
MSDRRAPRSFPRWPRWAVTPALIAKWEQGLKDSGIKKAELARRLGVTQGALTRLFNGEQHTSSLVKDINSVLALPAPSSLPERVLELLPLVDEGDMPAVIAVLEAMANKKRD